MMQRDSTYRKAGMALLLVLGTLVLLSVLVIAFFGSVTKELTASKTYSSGAAARIHADAAANLLLAQLRAATAIDDATNTWISQPGLIRRFDSQGNPDKTFKLYSSDSMVLEGAYSPLLDPNAGTPADVPSWSSSTGPADLPWNAEPGVYTDLNAPVTTDSGPKYPILNPGALTKIDGFDVSSQFSLPDSADFDHDGDTGDIGQIPMPVRWLYLLADGRLAVAATSGPGTVTLTLGDGGVVDANNPPVARIAFWTDDDTSRLNVNTASEGDFWTLPIAVAADDSLSSGQINAKEYQRYPGHPATTSLSPVFNFLTSSTGDLKNFIYAMAPRVSGRGSQSGSRYIGYTMPINLDNDRLYADVDDLLFLPTVDTAGKRLKMSTDNMVAQKSSELDWKYTGGNNQSMTGTNYSFGSSFQLDPQRLELARFFLTTSSRAPEVNLFGKPRVSLWPVDTRSGYQSVYDKLLAFCGTVGGQPYYFQRQNPSSQTEDAQIARNVNLLSYLGELMKTPVPGLAGALSDKYSASDREQLLAFIFDWIRCVNIAYRDPAQAVLPYAWQSNPNSSGTTKPPGLPGSGQVTPIRIGAVQGLGRFPTLSKGAFAVVREKEEPVTATTSRVGYRVIFLMETYVPVLGYAGYIPDYHIDVSNLGSGFYLQTKVNAAPVMNTALQIGGGTMKVNVPANVEPYFGRAWGGTQGFNNLLLYGDPGSDYTLTARTIGSADPLTGYPYVSQPVELTVNNTDLNNIQVGLTTGTGQPQSVFVTFKDNSGAAVNSCTLPMPVFAPVRGSYYGNPAAGNDTTLKPDLQGRADQMADAYKGITGAVEEAWRRNKSIIGPRDVVRGVELGHGDLRLLAMRGTDATNLFVPHKDYTSTRPQAHSLLRPGGSVEAGPNQAVTISTAGVSSNVAINRGYLVNGSKPGFASGTPLNYLPQAPSAMTSLTASGPDFSNGIGSEGDGPHVLKADEGNSSFAGFNWGMSVLTPYQNQLFPYDSKLSLAFSPSRQVTSAVQLGTLPSKGGSPATPWRTLLFRPDLDGTHPAGANPQDSALLDLFWMPVVDPYPVSEPLSTAGKVNMNYQIAPFTYIHRSTAMLGALKASKLLAIPAEESENYKWSGYTVDTSKSRYALSYLYTVDGPRTLLFFDDRFKTDIFRSAAEICNIPLAPKQNANTRTGTGHPDNVPAHATATVNIGGATTADGLRGEIKKFWQLNGLTGDNTREAPYAGLYPRLTTQSNSYTVYVRAQALQVARTSKPGTFSELRDRVVGEYRGSYTVERRIDPANPSLPDFTLGANSSRTVYPYYEFKIRSAKQFVP